MELSALLRRKWLAPHPYLLCYLLNCSAYMTGARDTRFYKAEEGDSYTCTCIPYLSQVFKATTHLASVQSPAPMRWSWPA